VSAAATLTRSVPIVHNLDLSKPAQAAALAAVQAIVDAACLTFAEDGLTGYARISSDGDGRGLGVERQVEDIVRIAGFMGQPVARIVVENDQSASEYASKPRELWADVERGMRSGTSSHVLATSTSRLTRDLGELNELLKLRRVGASFTTAQGVRMYPTMTAWEVQMARQAGTQDAGESDLISERTRRGTDQAAGHGTPHGAIAYGWTRSRVRGGGPVDTVNEAEAAVVREAAQRVLGGETLRGIARDFNVREIPAPRAAAWSSTTLHKLVLRERNAARRVHRGEVVGPAAWSPILDDDTYDAVVALLADPERRTNKRGATPRNLLSGLIVCGLCGDSRVWIVARRNSDGAARAYQCKSCNRISRKAEPIDAHVADAVCGRLSQPNALDWLAQDADSLAAARAHLAGLQARSAELADAYAAGVLPLDQVTRANATLLPAIDAARAAVERARPVPAAVRTLAELGSFEDVVAAWELLSLDAQRAVVAELVTITLQPTQRRRFDADAVQLDWRTELGGKTERRAPAPF
jgi:DNA invertase Pin-like site-specific DNA recombinase